MEDVKRLPACPIGGSVIYNLERTGKGSWTGQVDILGVAHHVCFVEVILENGMQVPVEDPECIYSAVESMYEGDSPYQTVNLPGVEGDFICVIHPAC